MSPGATPELLRAAGDGACQASCSIMLTARIPTLAQNVQAHDILYKVSKCKGYVGTRQHFVKGGSVEY